MQHRRLALKREVLQELTATDLTAVVGGAPPETTKIVEVAETMYSCLAYISCHIVQCVARDTYIICVQN